MLLQLEILFYHFTNGTWILLFKTFCRFIEKSHNPFLKQVLFIKKLIELKLEHENNVVLRVWNVPRVHETVT